MGFVCFSSPTSSTASLLESCARCEGGYKASIYHPSLLLLVSLYYNVRLWSLFSVNNHGRNHSRVSQRDGAEKDSSGISAIELIGLLGSLSLRFRWLHFLGNHIRRCVACFDCSFCCVGIWYRGSVLPRSFLQKTRNWRCMFGMMGVLRAQEP